MFERTIHLAAALAAALFIGGSAAAQAPAGGGPAAPPYATTKVEGTDNVYIFRYGGHQAMFVVTPAGVIATDPIGYHRPAAQAYLAEIKKITPQPVKYLVYSHIHYDHASGGKPFKDQGAVFIAQRNGKARLEALKDPDVVMPDRWVDQKMNLSLGGTTVELNYVGRNHSDNALVMRLPKEKLIFTVDWIPAGSLPPPAAFGDFYPVEFQAGLRQVLAMDWDRMITGHPGPGGRLGTRTDVSNLAAYFDDLHTETKALAAADKCTPDGFQTATLGSKHPWATQPAMAATQARYCLYWTQGY